MPIIARCKGCRSIIYEGEVLQRGIWSNIPKAIMKRLDGKCPDCERKLEFPTAKNIRISPAPGVDYIGKRRHESR